MKTSEELGIEQKYKGSRQYRAAFKYRILQELVRDKESLTFVSRKYGVVATTIVHFRKEALEHLGYFRILNNMKSSEPNKDATALKKENEELKKALELAMLKVAALETLVDVAEDQFNIQIRKKPGAKQSK